MSKGFWILEDKITRTLMVLNHLLDVVIIIQNDSANFGKGQSSAGTQVLKSALRDAEKFSDLMGLIPLLRGSGISFRN